MKISSYSHAIPGRLRIKIQQVKGSQETGQRVERILKNLEGVTSVTANPLTGNVLVLFDPDVLTHTDVIERLVVAGYPEKRRGSRVSTEGSPLDRALHPKYVSRVVTDIVLQSAVEFAVKRAILALV